MELTFQSYALLLLVAAVVAMATRRMRLPYSVGLVVAGIALAMLPFAPHVGLTKDLLFSALLPPLLFEASFYLRWPDLRRDGAVIVLLATLGVVLSAVVTAAGMHALAEWPWVAAAVFGVLIAATDPVSVVATFRDARAHGRLLLLIEAESLLNDGTAAVAFAVVIAVAAGQQVSAGGIAGMLALTIGGGVICGGAVAAGALLLIGRTEDHLVEISLTAIAAYGSFLLADHFGMSGVLATITAGVTMGNYRGLGEVSERGKEAVQAFWDFAAFVANSLVFLLIGMHEAQRSFVAILPAAGAAIALVTAGRAVAIYPCCAMFAGSGLRVAMKHQHVLFWGGLRGALALALALALPTDIPRREDIVTVTFGVVAFSVFVQGLTVAPLLRRMGEIPRNHN